MSFLTIYKASAGSGKTFTLAAKYTAFLLSGEDMGHARLLAVTFTNKATGEMKTRILEKLYSIGYGTDDEDGFLKLVMTHLDEHTRALGIPLIRKRAQERLSQLVHDYDHFTVQTIDSFFQSLLSNLAHELGLAANFKVQINDREVYGKAVDNIMARIARLSEDGTGNPRDLQLRKWVSTYIRELIDADRTWKIDDSLKAFAKELFSDAYLTHQSQLKQILEDDAVMTAYKTELRNRANAIRKECCEKAEAMHRRIMGLGGSNDVETAYKAVFGGYGYQRGWPYVREAIAGNLEKEASKSVLAWMEEGDEAAAILRSYENLREAMVPIVNSLELSLDNIDHLRLLGRIAEEVEAINEEENHFMLAETPVLFDRLIGEDDAPFVMERAGNRFEHVMIDEFQDTSPMQWNNFEKLLINNTAQGKECLIVGDVKQGIYRWRGGDWKKLNELVDQNPDTTHDLDTNYRSAEQVVRFNNALFTKAPLAEGIAWPDDAEQKPNKAKGGYVRVRFNEEDVAEDVATQIRQLIDIQGIQLKDIAILLRRNADANELIDYFRANHPDLKMVSNEAFFLRSSTAVQRLMAALRFLRDVGADEKHRDRIAETYLRQYGELPEEFVAQRVQLARRPLYELCEAVIETFHLGDNPDEMPFVLYFLDQVLEYLSEHPSSLREFIAYWDSTLADQSIPGGDIDGIRILSIHKSKGLAFHTVLIPYCNWPMEEDHRGSLLWCDTKQPPYNTLPVLPIKQKKSMANSIYRAEYEEDHNSQRIENLNLLYVAFTRAEKNLLVWGETKGNGQSSADLLATTLAAMQEDAATKATQQPDEDTFEYGDMQLPAAASHHTEEERNPFVYATTEEEIPFSAQHAQPTFRQSSKALDFLHSLQQDDDPEDAQKGYIQEGTLLHDIFSRIITTEDIPAALASAQREGLVDAEWVEQHRGFITSRITGAKAREWFQSHWQVFNEQAIICPHPSRPLFTTRRPDRVITDGQRTIVIDFKFARHSADHVLQVEYYCELLREMGFPGVEGYLWYVYGNEVVSI